MMEKYEEDETFLARWIAGELSEEERIAFEKTDAFKQFDVINKEALTLEGPSINIDAALKKVKSKIHSDKKSTKIRRLWYPIAAAIVLLIGGVAFLNASKTYVTGIGEQQTIELADGSTVDLNANSRLSHKRFFWLNQKEVSLQGEGYFTIAKGEGFKVHTSQGLVEVLGTQFNIKDRTTLEISCYEGKVRYTPVDDIDESTILTKGMFLNVTTGTLKEGVTAETPDWKSGTSTFIDTPFQQVLEELMNYYPINFDVDGINTERLFTGSFTHDNLETALQATLTPMGITYKTTTIENTYILSE